MGHSLRVQPLSPRVQNTPKPRIYHTKSTIAPHLPAFSKQNTRGKQMNASAILSPSYTTIEPRIDLICHIAWVNGQQGIWHSALKEEHERGLASSAICLLGPYKAEPVSQTDCPWFSLLPLSAFQHV